MQYIRTPQEAEANAALRMRELGFPDASVTVGGADGGIDVRSSGALAQVKWRGGMVGRPELQNLFGARGNDFSKSLLFFAASDYSQHAVEYADSLGIALFVYEPHGAITPKNTHATVLRAGTNANQDAAYGGLQGAGTPAYPNAQAKPGFWAETAWPFLKIHWRIVGAVWFTIGVIAFIPDVINPDEAMGETREQNVGYLVTAIVFAVVLWILFFVDRERKKQSRAELETQN